MGPLLKAYGPGLRGKAVFRKQAEDCYFVENRLLSFAYMPSSAPRRTDEYREKPAPEREADVLRSAVEAIRERLPPSWQLDVATERLVDREARVDGELRLRAPDGQQLVVLVEAKRLLSTRDVPGVLDELRRVASRWGSEQAVVNLVAARYLAPGTRERIAELDGSYVDATGNVLLSAERPGLFLRDRGADRDPWRGPGRPRGTLQGPPAARVVRALIDFAPPYTAPELAERSGASTGATYRVVEFLEEEGLLERRRYGPIGDVRWQRLLRRWSEDYGFVRSNTVATFLEPRGLQALTARLRSSEDLEYVVTGSLAAERLAPYAPARLATLYVRDLGQAAETLKLRPVDGGANVALATGDYDVVFDRPELVGGVRFAAVSQVVVDLLTGPGRNPSEADALLEWMDGNERLWRRPAAADRGATGAA